MMKRRRKGDKKEKRMKETGEKEGEKEKSDAGV